MRKRGGSTRTRISSDVNVAISRSGTLKEGTLCVFEKKKWQSRYVVLSTGELLIFKSNKVGFDLWVHFAFVSSFSHFLLTALLSYIVSPSS